MQLRRCDAERTHVGGVRGGLTGGDDRAGQDGSQYEGRDPHAAMVLIAGRTQQAVGGVKTVFALWICHTGRAAANCEDVNDMRANLERLKSLVAPDSGLSDEDRSAAYLDLYDDDVILRWQGSDWPFGGDMEGRDRLIACLQAASKLFAEPPQFWESHFWILDEERLIWWWRSRSTTFRGDPFTNSGITLLRYRDDRICEHWEYTDTEYIARMLRGWRSRVDPEVGALLANWNDGRDPAA